MKELEKLRSIMKSLRDPDTGCPWDKQQTIDSIKGFTIEEAYEVVDAIDRKDMNGLSDELGDLLFHIIFYSEMADELGEFSFDTVVEQVNEKLLRRHPHVFSDKKLDSIEDVKTFWEEIKQQERQSKAESSPDSILADISNHIPAVQRAKKLQKRAASVGFDWTEASDITNKIVEELNELTEVMNSSKNQDKLTEEFGDLLFCCINLSRHLKIDPELALRQTNEKFIKRFNYIEQSLKDENILLKEAGLEKMDALWDEAKDKLT